MLLAITFGTLFAFVIFTAILCLVAWGLTKIPKPDWMNVVIYVILGVFFLLMVYDLFTGGHAMPRLG